MASIRKLKKDINAITFDLLTDCYIYKMMDDSIAEEKLNEVIMKIVYLRNDLILRSNHPEADGESVNIKEHYRKISEDLFELMGTIDELKK